jgi:hypothetical protein
MTSNESFIAHLDKSRERVNNWPEWKKQNSSTHLTSAQQNLSPKNTSQATHKPR